MNPFRRAHNKFVEIITYPSIIDHTKFAEKKRPHVNLTCIRKGHQMFVDFKTKKEECVRCGKVAEP